MSADTIPAKSARRLSGRKVLVMFVAFFGTIACADAILITSALRSWPGAETTSPYRAGQLFSAEIAKAREQDASGLALEIVVSPRATGAVIEATLLAADGNGRRRALVATLQRPTDKRMDRTAAFERVAAGRYRAIVPALPPGQWDLVVDVVEGGERVFRRKTRIELP